MSMELITKLDAKFWSKGRLETFGKWPIKSKDGTCTPERMAAAGFYVVEGLEEPDVVACFICAKQLDGWEANDDPWKEHAKHQKDCPFVLLNKQDEMLWTIDDLFHLIKLYYVKRLECRMDESITKIKLQSQTMAKKIPKIYKTAQMNKNSGK